MIITRRSLPRRAFLRGLGTTLALPLLDGMVPVKKLLAKGVSLDARTAKRASGSSAGAAPRDPGELTPLLVAARANQQEVMRVLAAVGADPSLKADDGSTLLMAAAARGTIGTVQYTYELDQRIDAVDEAGATVMHASVISASGRSPDQICAVIQFLADRGARQVATSAS